MSAVALSRLILDQILFLARGVNRWRYVASVADFRIASIQPKQMAVSRISWYASLMPDDFLSRIKKIPLDFADSP